MIAVEWRVRTEPLAIEGACAFGDAATRLAQRLLSGAPEGIRAAATSDCLVLLGQTVKVMSSNDLPWVDGIVYLGREEGTPQLYMPTTLQPSVPVALLARALGGRAPVAVIGSTIISLAALAPLEPARLQAWLAA